MKFKKKGDDFYWAGTAPGTHGPAAACPHSCCGFGAVASWPGQQASGGAATQLVHAPISAWSSWEFTSNFDVFQVWQV